MPEQPLTVTYVGALYRTLRDPSVLYEAIKRAGLTPKDIQVSFYGSNPADIYPLVDKFDVADFVIVKDRVPYKKSLEIQRDSDVLLLLQSPKDPRNVPAKIFEYLASRRPILGLGLDEGIPAKLIRERQAGLYHTDAEAVAQQLKAWLAQKRATGFIPNLPPRVHSGLSRAEQLEHLAEMLRSAV
jgi:hypothetical protein